MLPIIDQGYHCITRTEDWRNDEHQEVMMVLPLVIGHASLLDDKITSFKAPWDSFCPLTIKKKNIYTKEKRKNIWKGPPFYKHINVELYEEKNPKKHLKDGWFIVYWRNMHFIGMPLTLVLVKEVLPLLNNEHQPPGGLPCLIIVR